MMMLDVRRVARLQTNLKMTLPREIQEREEK